MSRATLPAALAAILSLAILTLGVRPSLAQTPAQTRAQGPAETTVCLDVSGAKSPPTCRTPASRLQPSEDICTCASGVMVKAQVCPAGVTAPAESLALKTARKAAAKDGTLVGDAFEGKPMCETARLNR